MRYDIETEREAELRTMMETQGATGGFLPENEQQMPDDEVDTIIEREKEKEGEEEGGRRRCTSIQHEARRPCAPGLTCHHLG
jgi:hypothetical protein